MKTDKLEKGTGVQLKILFGFTIGEEGDRTGKTLNTIEDCENEVKEQLDWGDIENLKFENELHKPKTD